MARLFRPSIPLAVQYRVALRQLGTLWIDEAVREATKERRLGHWVKYTKARLMELHCWEAVHLDHDPPLAARQRRPISGGKIAYTPAANDPEFLIYREKHAHHIKTNVRGDGAQHPDRVLIKRERKRREQKTAKRQEKYNQKYNWPKRKLRSASRWPSRKMRT